MIKREDVVAVLSALAEEFLIDVPAVWTTGGVCLIDFTALANAFANPDVAWVDQIAGYVNARELEDTFLPNE